ncbi:MAG TPA: hypothetical protein VGR92_06120 [Steroidobacteraceae bacterium]|nr:hypothetical protein [Steroidobacteraceae bacterium]
MTLHPIEKARVMLPAHVVPMLRNDGIVTLEDWRALGERRFKLFGITPRTVEVLDQAAEEALK